MSARWSWRWIPSDPPAGFGDNLLFDIVRLFLVLAAILLTAATVRVLLEQRRRAHPFPRGQASRFLALLGLTLYCAATELAVFGTSATPRLLVGLASIGFGIDGVRCMRRDQLAQPIIRD